jgi:hypothetical protein
MPHLNDHVQFGMPPIRSMGLASYRYMTNALKDEKGTNNSPICNIVYMITAVIQNDYDKVTLVASIFSSIRCKPSNLVILPIFNYSSQCYL